MIKSTKILKNTCFVIPAKRVFVILMATICCLTLLNLAAFQINQLSIKNYWFNESIESLVRLLNTNGEANIPSWYSSSALLAASALLFLITALKARASDSYLMHWKFMAIIFLYLSLDETAVIHEMLSKPLQAILHTDGLLYYPWVLVAGFCLVLLFFVYAQFLLHLPANIRLLFIVSGIIFVFGAIVVESFQAYKHSLGRNSAADFIVPTTIEEFLEMTGIALFIYSLMQYINEHLLGSQSTANLQHNTPIRLDTVSVDSAAEFKETSVECSVDVQPYPPNS
mgnify:CR=1 FL=1